MDDTEASPTELKKRPTEKLNATIQVLHDSPDKTPPLVAHFPSGFDPSTHLRGGGSPEPGVRVYRHSSSNWPKRLLLLVRPPESNVTFVEFRELTSTDYYSYRLGVLDKESHTLKIVPIARDKSKMGFSWKESWNSLAKVQLIRLNGASGETMPTSFVAYSYWNLEFSLTKSPLNWLGGEFSAKEKADKVKRN